MSKQKMNESLNNQIVTASKWSVLSEVVAKLVTPITSMILARLLTPEAFGVVATMSMIITFAEIFTDAGFQKYLIQHEFKDKADLFFTTNVAFWSNLVLSVLIWLIIILFREEIAILVGNPGLGDVVAVACVSIPIAAFSSIQMALFKRELNYKVLFKFRIVAVMMPIFVIIPLALLLKNYWALIIGDIIRSVIIAGFMTYYSEWKPQIVYSFNRLKEMLSFTVWSMIEAVSIWLASYVDIFLVGTLLSQYYLGLYKTATSTVGLILSLVTSATTPILFASLSRVQNDDTAFKDLFLKFQKVVGALVIPLGIGIYCYSDVVTAILLGNQWMEAAGLVGIWGLTSSVMIVLAHYSSEVYRAKGKPKLSVLAHWLHIIVLWPTVIIAIKYGFEVLYTARALVRLEGILVNMTLMYVVIKISPTMMIKNVFPSCLAGAVMLTVSFGLNLFVPDHIGWRLIQAIVSVAFYIIIIDLFPTEKALLHNFYIQTKQKILKKH